MDGVSYLPRIVTVVVAVINRKYVHLCVCVSVCVPVCLSVYMISQKIMGESTCNLDIVVHVYMEKARTRLILGIVGSRSRSQRDFEIL